MLAKRRCKSRQSSSSSLENTLDTRTWCCYVLFLSLANLNLIKSPLTNKLLNGVRRRSWHVQMTFIDLCHKFFSVPTPFLSLGQKSHRKANIARAFRTWTSSCKWRKWWSCLTNCKLKNNLPFIACHLCHFNSFHLFVTWQILILLRPLNHVNPLMRRKMPHSNISTEAPSQCRPSIGRATGRYGPSKTEPLSPSSTKWHSNLTPEPTHRQT